VLTGKAEAGSTVTVTNSTGTVGTALVDDQGNFTITLNPAQNNGEALTARNRPGRQYRRSGQYRCARHDTGANARDHRRDG
jgi:hypothetical protein